MKRFAENFWFTLFLTIAFAVSALLLVLLPAVAMPRLQAARLRNLCGSGSCPMPEAENFP